MQATHEIKITRPNRSDARSNFHAGVKKTRWLWPGRIPDAALSLIVCGGNCDRTLVLADLASRLSRGTEWPDETPVSAPADVLWFSYSANVEKTIQPALLSAGGDTDRIRLFSSLMAMSRRDEQLDGFLRAMPDVRMVLVDLDGFLVNVGCHDERAMPGAIARVVEVARRRAVAVVGAIDLGATTAADISRSWAGAIGYSNAADVGLGLGLGTFGKKRSPSLFPLKNTLQASMPPCIPYHVTEGRVVWDAHSAVSEGSRN
jgi:hypothetical protein